MNRSPKAACLGALALATLVVLLPTPSPAAGRSPNVRVSGPVTADADVLARTAPELATVKATTTAPAACTGWRNTVQPPPTIRVYRTTGPAAGTVQTVPFRAYVATTFSAEWPSYYPPEVLKAGAIAVKQYGWYYTIVYRKKLAPNGECYDVVDNTIDQYYRPETRFAAASHNAALDATWRLSLRKWTSSLGTSRLFLTGYRAGAFVDCGADRDGWKLYQHSAFMCPKQQGLNWEGILRRYLDPNLEIVDPSQHNVLTGIRGDALAVVPGTTEGTIEARAYASTGKALRAAVAPPTLPLDITGTVGLASGDVTGDNLQDLVALGAGTDGQQRLTVMAANGAGHNSPTTWQEPAVAAGSDARLLVGDFDGDSRADAGLLSSTAGDVPTATLQVALSTGTTFAAPKTWWTGALDLTTATTYAADVNGDARADLVVEEDRGELGLRYSVMPSRNFGGALEPAAVWLDATELRRATTKTIVSDLNRDGRDDMVVVTPAATGSKVTQLRARGATFVRVARWTSPSTSPVAFETVKLGAGDFNIDGRGDVLLYLDRGAAGTRMTALLATEKGMTASTWLDDATLQWDALRPL